MTLYVNLFAGPGAGKSTTAAHLFALMKHEGHSVELVTEWCKLFAYDPHGFPMQQQIYANQCELLLKPRGAVGCIVTDSPILLTSIYGTERQDALRAHKLFSPSFNIFLRRAKPYNPVGREQTEEEALAKDKEIYGLFPAGWDMETTADKYAAAIILDILKDRAEQAKREL